MKTIHIFLIFSVLAVSCQNERAKEPQTASSADTTAQVPQGITFSNDELKTVDAEVGTPTIETLSGRLVLSGSIDVPPQSTVSLSFPLGGYLKSTNMLPGMHVRKGQVLAMLEDMQFIQLQQDFLTAKEKFQLAETEFKRQKDLNASKAASDKVFQQSKSEMETQKILMNALGQKLELIGISPSRLRADNISKSVPITSPIDGFVSRVNVNVGKYTSPTDMLFELVDPKDIHLALSVFEKDLNKLAVGQLVEAYTNSEPDRKFSAKVILVSKNLNGDRMAEVHCHFDKYSPTLVPGMFVNGEVVTTSVKTLTVPEEAVVRWENKFYIFEETKPGQFDMKEIEAGVVENGRQQIKSADLNVHTRMIVKNAYGLLMKIKNTEEES